MPSNREKNPPGPQHARRPEPVRPDTVLLRRELRWTATAILAVAIYGHAQAGAVGGAIGACTGYLLQQSMYRIVVHLLWSGWRKRFITGESADWTKETSRRALRAFALWMRTARLVDRVYVSLWNVRLPDSEDHKKELQGMPLEYPVWRAFQRADLLGRYPLRCDNLTRSRLRRSLQRDETTLLHLATGEKLG